MSKILAIDLGKFKSVTCLLETETNETEFWIMATERHYLETVLKRYTPDLVVIEACTIAGWVHDVCTSQGYRVRRVAQDTLGWVAPRRSQNPKKPKTWMSFGRRPALPTLFKANVIAAPLPGQSGVIRNDLGSDGRSALVRNAR